MTFAKKIKKIRKIYGWSQMELAERCGLDQHMISDYETGRAEPSITTLRKIAFALDTSMSDVLEGVI